MLLSTADRSWRSLEIIMPAITQPTTRDIISDFAVEISKRQVTSAKPSKAIINFRNDLVDKFERDIVKVPIDLLRFRKDNGRIASDVIDHENTTGILDEGDEEVQRLLRKFLARKDPEKTEILFKNILHAGQLDPAIVTCDGFLINGNRRKMVMVRLGTEHPNDERFRYINVVILPGMEDEGGPPTLLEIEKLENRYQLQSEGKSEYYGFDRALSIRRKIQIGLSLVEQISDDPQYAGADKPQIDKAIKGIKKKYLDPLDCVDRYLKQFNREGQYHTVSSGMGDREGRWQAFIDYSNTYNTKFSNQNYLLESGIEEDEIGDMEEAAFDVIRLRNVPGMPKVHTIMRDLHKFCGTREGKKELLNIPKKVEPILPIEQLFEDAEQEKPLSREDIDAKWAAGNMQAITFHLKRASKIYESQREKETPIDLLEAALKKLTHKNMDLSSIAMGDYDKARELTAEIQKEASELEHKIYRQKKNLKKLTRKK